MPILPPKISNSYWNVLQVFEGLERSDTSRQRSSDAHSRSWEGLGNQPSIFSPWKTFGAKTSLFAFEVKFVEISEPSEQF